MTIQVLGLKGETLRLSDSHHSQIITKDEPSFTLAEGENEFTIEQISCAPARSSTGWISYLLVQILTAPFRALAFRKPIYLRCSPILLSARVKVKPTRYDFLTLFFNPGGYNKEVHSYQPPTIEGDKELVPENFRYTADPTAVEKAIKEETMSKAGYCIAMLMVPLLLLILSVITNYGIFFAASLGNLPFMLTFCLLAQLHSRRAKKALREKINDTLRFLNGEI